MRYTPSDVFETFPMPSTIQCVELGAIGERYHGHRAALMRFHGLGLTKVYNLFHSSELNAGVVARVVKQGSDAAASGYVAMIELRNLHAEMDIAVRDAYGWHDLSLEHDFYEVEGLPENDCVRYTISPAARREILKRLLDENHRRASQETNNSDMICKQTGG
jgi:hypothetical protein